MFKMPNLQCLVLNELNSRSQILESAVRNQNYCYHCNAPNFSGTCSLSIEVASSNEGTEGNRACKFTKSNKSEIVQRNLCSLRKIVTCSNDRKKHNNFKNT